MSMLSCNLEPPEDSSMWTQKVIIK